MSAVETVDHYTWYLQNLTFNSLLHEQKRVEITRTTNAAEYVS